ncbi:hypothetical protein IB276_17850 [Ensifer sp. ENS04]|uniref:hypothetical protein n=1 Tax=Ensifer sp. ENS04 TaxID=2769281 RepID=UPI00177E9E6A|nr:hypothetical protein [Ensifer sp. ENS04]MBD9541322.1 hypothetical protein [Ensifer sp. ENS04]
MTDKHLTTLWKWMALACFGYVASSVLTIQGAADIFGTRLLSKSDHGLAVVAYMAAIVGSGLMLMVLVVAITYARRYGTAWHDRIPTIMLDGLQTASIEGKIYQSAVVFVLIALPFYGIGHSMRVANEGEICVQGTSPPVVYGGGNWTLLAVPHAKTQVRLVSGGVTDGRCEGGVEVGWYTPLLFGVLPFCSALLAVIWMWQLFRRPRGGLQNRSREDQELTTGA